MRPALMRSLRALCLAAAVFCVLRTAVAAGGREFAASYQFANITEENNVVHLTITLNLRNNAPVSVRNGSVVLLSSEANPNLLGSFALLKSVPSFHLVTMSQTFTVSKSEYELWEQGRDPSLRFVVEDPNGALRTLEIDLHRIRTGVAATK